MEPFEVICIGTPPKSAYQHAGIKCKVVEGRKYIAVDHIPARYPYLEGYEFAHDPGIAYAAKYFVRTGERDETAILEQRQETEAAELDQELADLLYDLETA